MLRRSLHRAPGLLRWQHVASSLAETTSSTPTTTIPDHPILHQKHYLSTTAGQTPCPTPIGPNNAKQRLLEAALRRVSAMGWTSATLHMAARDLGISPALVGVLPNAEADLIKHFLDHCNTTVTADLRARGGNYTALSTQEKVHIALKLRLGMLEPYMNNWSQALAVLAQPQNAAIAASSLSSTVDTIWYAAGDTSTDSSWYTKRAALSAVYTSTQLYMLTDTSPGYHSTWEFLERRVSDMFTVGYLGEAASRQLKYFVDGILGGVLGAVGQQPRHQQPPTQQCNQSAQQQSDKQAGEGSSGDAAGARPDFGAPGVQQTQH